MKMIFYGVDNSQDYSPDTFYKVDSHDAFEMLKKLHDDEWVCYNVDPQELMYFQYDFNAERFDGGWWCLVLTDNIE